MSEPYSGPAFLYLSDDDLRNIALNLAHVNQEPVRTLRARIYDYLEHGDNAGVTSGPYATTES